MRRTAAAASEVHARSTPIEACQRQANIRIAAAAAEVSRYNILYQGIVKLHRAIYGCTTVPIIQSTCGGFACRTAGPRSWLRKDFQPDSHHLPVTLSVGPPYVPTVLPTVGSMNYPVAGYSRNSFAPRCVESPLFPGRVSSSPCFRAGFRRVPVSGQGFVCAEGCISCLWRNEIYYTSAISSLVWPTRVVILLLISD